MTQKKSFESGWWVNWQWVLHTSLETSENIYPIAPSLSGIVDSKIQKRQEFTKLKFKMVEVQKMALEREISYSHCDFDVIV